VSQCISKYANTPTIAAAIKTCIKKTLLVRNLRKPIKKIFPQRYNFLKQKVIFLLGFI